MIDFFHANFSPSGETRMAIISCKHDIIFASDYYITPIAIILRKRDIINTKLII